MGNELRGKALADFVVATGSDGYQSVLALGEVDPNCHTGEVLVADTMDGIPLDPHAGPLKLVVTEDKRPARSVRNLVQIELKTGSYVSPETYQPILRHRPYTSLNHGAKNAARDANL